MPVNPAARFQVDPVAYNAPGNCFVCKTDKGPFIRTGLHHDYFKEAPDASRDGDVYICAGCVRDMSNTLRDYESPVDQFTDATRTGILEGILIAKRIVDEFANRFLDDSLAITGSNGGRDGLIESFERFFSEINAGSVEGDSKDSKEATVSAK